MRINYDVNPTYSCGSGALVDLDTARKVAWEEATGYTRAKSGRYGEDAPDAAKARGLAGIVYKWYQVRIGAVVFDMITGERHEFTRFSEFQAWSKGHREATRRYRDAARGTVVAVAV